MARDLLAILCGTQGVATLVIDLNRTHATNPLWPRHARFHLVWQATSYALLSLLEVAFVIIAGPYQEQRFYLASLLASIPMLGCISAYLFRQTYDGALSDPNGIPPVRFAAFSLVQLIDLNLTAEIVALLLLLGIVALFRH